MKNTSIKLHNFVDEPGTGCIVFDAALPLANGQALHVPIEYDPQYRRLVSCNVELPHGFLGAIRKAVEKPIRDELYRGIEHDLFVGAELTATLPR